MSENKGNSSKIIGIAMIVVVILISIILGFLIFYVQKGKRKTENNNQITQIETTNKIQTNNNQINRNQINNNRINGNNTNTAISNTNTSINTNTAISNTVTNVNNEKATPLPLNIKGKQGVNGSGGELITINDYKILIPEQLVKIGYKVNKKGNILAIQANDNSYACILMQISDNYVMPKEEEIDAFYETQEYKAWNNEKYDIDNEIETNAHLDKYSEISSAYYKKLGYTVKNSPDYTMTNKEKQELIGGYLKEGRELSSVMNGLFPGYSTQRVYDWGEYTLYSIPKYYKDSQFGEKTSNLSICLYIFEYYDREKTNFNVDLWTY